MTGAQERDMLLDRSARVCQSGDRMVTNKGMRMV